MKYRLSIAVLSVGVFILAGAGLSLADDSSAPAITETAAPATPAVSAAPAAAAAPSTAITPAEAPSITPGGNEPDVLWLWGDVVAVDALKNEITVKYLDYESDNEKEIPVSVNDKTAFENIKTLAELKAQDTVSIDYVVLDGKNIAKNISVEKPESVEPVKDTVAAPDAPASDAAAPDQSAPEAKPQTAE